MGRELMARKLAARLGEYFHESQLFRHTLVCVKRFGALGFRWRRSINRWRHKLAKGAKLETVAQIRGNFQGQRRLTTRHQPMERRPAPEGRVWPTTGMWIPEVR